MSGRKAELANVRVALQRAPIGLSMLTRSKLALYQDPLPITSLTYVADRFEPASTAIGGSVAQMKGRPLSPAAADNSHPSRTAMCMVVMTADFPVIVFMGKSKVTIIESLAGVLYIYARVTTCIESRNREVGCQNRVSSLSFCAKTRWLHVG